MNRDWKMEVTKEDKNAETHSEDSTTVEVQGNHIYFYNGVDIASALKINKHLQDLVIKLMNLARVNGFDRPTVHLHINSGGGSVDAGISIMDTILRLKKDVNIYTYVEGMAASAATLISLVGTKRYMTSHSSMLIHQLSAGMWGKYSELKDDIENYDNLMKLIKTFYSEYTKISVEELDQILHHDLFWSAEKCLENGLIDEII